MIEEEIKTLFLDIGGVLLTNGWEYDARLRAIKKFRLDHDDMEERHNLFVDNYEMGKITLDEYLKLVVFYKKRRFSKIDFEIFMYQQSKALNGNIDFFITIKHQYRLKVIAVSNEGRELNNYRIMQYKLDELFDAYISSCYVHIRKPDENILQLACDISHTEPGNGLYIDDRPLLVDLAHSFGLQTHHFENLEKTKTFIEKKCIFY